MSTHTFKNKQNATNRTNNQSTVEHPLTPGYYCSVGLYVLRSIDYLDDPCAGRLAARKKTQLEVAREQHDPEATVHYPPLYSC